MARLGTWMLCVMIAAAPAHAATPAAGAKPKSVAKVNGAKSPGAKTPYAKAPAASATPDSKPKAPDDSTMTMRGGQEGTVFKSLVVEGEDRIRLEFDRPELKLELDPSQAPGLDWGSARDVLDRTVPDLARPLAMESAREPSPYVAHPWLSHFASGAVARFRPDLKGVASWRLSIVNARGETVATYSGHGEPPREIAWDGRSQGGAPVVPGLTYSYVLEAKDKAGNKRNFVGQGFKVSAYRLETADGPVMLLSARELPAMTPGGAPTSVPAGAPPILIEAASWLNQREKPNQPVRVTATAKSYEAAQTLADFVTRAMTPHLIGDPARIQAVAQVQADAPEGGTIQIASTR